MKHLIKYKLFETIENLDSKGIEIFEFTDDCLSWLKDDGDFRIEVEEVCINSAISTHPYVEDLCVYRVKLLTDRILLDRVWGSKGFDWNEIKDEYIRYIHLLKDKYKIIGYNSEININLDKESVEIFYQEGEKEHKRVYYKIVPIEELEKLKLDNIRSINVYVERIV